MNNSVPKHIVLIPDGNRRWAREQGLDTMEGHKIGFEKFVDFTEWCQKRGVEHITAFGFSTENWNRSDREVKYLLKLFEVGLLDLFRKYTNDGSLKEKGVRLRVIGDRTKFPDSLKKAISEVEQGTSDNDKINVNIALSYGGRWDIVQAVKRSIAEGVSSDDVTEDSLTSMLSLGDSPDADMVIRTSGEMRISNFVLWHMAYSELMFVEKHWPAFTEDDLAEVINEYSSRQRRFGK